MAKKLIPRKDSVIARPIEAESTTASGIIIPETASKEKPRRAEIVAVGPGKLVDGKLIPIDLEVGDIVIFSLYAPTEIKVDGVEYYIISEDSITAIEKEV